MDIIDAIIKKDAHKVKQLLEKGADPNQTDDWDNVTPLHHAVLQNAVEIAILLLVAGADPNARTTADQQTPLELAKELRHQRMVNLLKTFM